ncbi:hypothetical protein BC936DRAFT_137544 [Jimgerdemannia flammicorona]|uniref:Uncharacterized protein n=1 Tax=Jimgerdemannia flammicorona TaxID=994334 RepID=A0A433CX35_9FUNG|nr:hypothetical protein BC936DRAFT_137544 [Jimgerdemannia flammicorona]
MQLMRIWFGSVDADGRALNTASSLVPGVCILPLQENRYPYPVNLFCRSAVFDDLQSVEGTIPVSEITSSSPQSNPTKSRATSSTPNVSEPQPTPERDESHGGIFANSQLTISKSGDPVQIAFQLGREMGRMEGQFVASSVPWKGFTAS